MKKLKQMIFISCLLLEATIIKAQTSVKNYPVIGKPMPAFNLSNVHYYSKMNFNTTDLKGKWTIMDFWTKYCTSCVQSFPKVNELQNEFKDQVQFLLVAKNNKKLYGNTDQIYERFRKKLGLQLPIAYDSIIFEQFGVEGVPHIIVIDPQGNVYAVTDTYFLTEDNLRNLVQNNRPPFKKKYSSHEQIPLSFYGTSWKYLVNEKDEKQDFQYRSILSNNAGEPSAGSWVIDQNINKGCYQVARSNLFQLYNIAYLGESEWHRWRPLYVTHWTYPLLEINDSTLFQFDYTNNKGLYNYSMIVPKEKATKAHLMEVMQRDLKNYFGYDVLFETRMMSYWKLSATDEARETLPSKSEIEVDKREASGMDCKKTSVGLVLSLVEEYNMDEHFPFIDETNIKVPIDISFEAMMTDMDDVCKALRKHGLILEKSKKEMKVLVIRDPRL